MQNHNYFLVLYQKDRYSIPRAQGHKPISKEEYTLLCDKVITELEANLKTWEIKERRIFEIAEQRKLFGSDDSIAINCYVVIDAEEKK